MRIVFFSDDFPPQSFGGAGISTYDLALGMKRAGHDVSVITTCRKKEEALESEYEGLKIFKIASDYSARWRAYLGLHNLSAVRQVEALFKKIKPDVVHVNNVHFYLSYHTIKISKRYAKAVVFTARDAMSFSYGKLTTKRYLKDLDAHLSWWDNLKQAKKRWNPLRNVFIRKYLKYPDKLLAVSSALKIALEQNGIKGFEVMHSGADTDRWQASPQEITSFKSKYELGDKKIIFFGGRLNEAKGSNVVAEVMQSVKESFPDVILFTPNSNGIWLDRDEMRYALTASDLVLVPSLCFDALPRLVLEASASGKPVISTPYGGAKEIIEDGITGYVVKPSNTEEFAEKILDLLKNPEKAKKFGDAGRERIKTQFNLNDKIARHLEIYEKLYKKNSSN